MCLSLTGPAGNVFLGVIGPGAKLLKIALYCASLHVLCMRFKHGKRLMRLARTPGMDG